MAYNIGKVMIKMTANNQAVILFCANFANVFIQKKFLANVNKTVLTYVNIILKILVVT
jgi:hypothetical protein